jgi:type II secretory pathway component PulF
MASERQFAYGAVDTAGRDRKGLVGAASEAEAFMVLRAEGLAPLWIKPAKDKKLASVGSLGDRETADLLSNLAELLVAGADIRTALAILGARADRPAIQQVCQALTKDIGGGEALDRAFGRGFARHQALVAALVAAGETSGDLPGSLRRTAQMVEARLKLREQLASVLAYPAFVLLSAVAALLVILLVIVPTLAPLVADLGGEPPAAMRVMIAASDFLHDFGLFVLAGVALTAAGIGLAAKLQWLTAPMEHLFLDGPAQRTASSVVYGGFSIALGTMLAAGAPMNEALRLATKAIGAGVARHRLEVVGVKVRQGESLSAALSRVKGFPNAIVRLAAVGEASSSLGQMLSRGGTLEEEGALRRIRAIGQIAGPALIVLMGLFLGLLMAGLLSGISQMGQGIA